MSCFMSVSFFLFFFETVGCRHFYTFTTEEPSLVSKEFCLDQPQEQEIKTIFIYNIYMKLSVEPSIVDIELQ